MPEPVSREAPCLQATLHTVKFPKWMRKNQPWETAVVGERTRGRPALGLEPVNTDLDHVIRGQVSSGLEGHMATLSPLYAGVCIQHHARGRLPP